MSQSEIKSENPSRLTNFLSIAGQKLDSRFFIGTALYPSPSVMQQSIVASQAQVVTVSLRRQMAAGQKGNNNQSFVEFIRGLDAHLLPNTAGCHSAKEAILTATMARELFNTNWIKLEVIGDDYNLQPDPFALVEAAKELIEQGFKVFPYCSDDLVVCQKLLEVGCEILMPWGAPIGTGKGLANKEALKTLRQRLPDVPMIIDAGMGAPSHACEAMELGFDAVLLNSAVAKAQDPILMAQAFKQGIEAGRLAYLAGLMQQSAIAEASTPVVGTPFWHS